MSAQRYLKTLAHLMPAGAVGISLALGAAAPAGANEERGGPQTQKTERDRVCERLSDIRDAVTSLSGQVTDVANTDRRLAWGNWREPGWHNWNNWHNWHNSGNSSYQPPSSGDTRTPTKSNPLRLVAASGVGIGLLAVLAQQVRHRRRRKSTPTVQVTLGVDKGHVRIIRRDKPT